MLKFNWKERINLSKKIHPTSPQDSHVVGIKNDGRIENSFSYIKDWYNSIIKNGNKIAYLSVPSP